jgi:signal transduction histidine kinase
VIPHLSERAVVLAPQGRDAVVACAMLGEADISCEIAPGLPAFVALLSAGAGFGLVTEEALASADLQPLVRWIEGQSEWSDFPFILLTQRGGGLERNPAAGRYLYALGNVTFLERPFHPTTLISLAQSALRGRRRQYEARTRLEELHALAANLEKRVEERTAEREDALRQLHEAQKLETIGQLTGGVAHDFNNLLTPITGALDYLQRRHGDADPRSVRLIGNALQAADRATLLVQRLLGFARRQSLQTRAVDVRGLLKGIRDLISSSIGPTIELHIRADAGTALALADPNQLELAILNLCVNARDAMPRGGVLSIVDDEEIVRAATGELIRDLGHQVTEAGSGAEGLGKLAAGLHVDVVISDYKMPRMNGAEFARRVGEMRPGTAVLIITGYTGTADDLPDLPRLAKPFSQADIAAALTRLLDGDGKVVRLVGRRDKGK